MTVIEEADPRPRRIELRSLTSLRFFAAAAVFSYHSTLTVPNMTAFRPGAARYPADVFSKFGWIGVSFFFVLSGFVLTWSARPGERPREFWRRRAVKIYPNHVVTFALAMVLFAAAITPARTAVLNLFLLHSWVPNLTVFNSVNLPSWSLCCEVLFYALFPALLTQVWRIKPERLWAWVIGICAYAIVLPALAYALLPSAPAALGSSIPVTAAQYWIVHVLPVSRVPEFFLGMVLARIVLSGRWIGIKLLPATILLAAGCLVANVVPFLYGMYASTLLPVALVIGAAATADIRGTVSVLQGRTMVRLGEISFAFYMVHGVVLLECRKLLGYTKVWPVPGAVAATATAFAIAVAAAFLLHAAVEKPMMKRFSRARVRPVPLGGPVSRPLPRPAAATDQTALLSPGPVTPD